jgi:asparagine synthetase B (glutamine-hydrolysing)
VLRLDVTTLIVDDPVKRVDNMTMAWGLEARVPFLDHELVELAMQLPPAPENWRRRQIRVEEDRPWSAARCGD